MKIQTLFNKTYGKPKDKWGGTAKRFDMWDMMNFSELLLDNRLRESIVFDELIDKFPEYNAPYCIEVSESIINRLKQDK